MDAFSASEKVNQSDVAQAMSYIRDDGAKRKSGRTVVAGDAEQQQNTVRVEKRVRTLPREKDVINKDIEHLKRRLQKIMIKNRGTSTL
jgi:hypothetical protein